MKESNKPTMKTYIATIDGGEGGETTITANSVQEALVEAVEWAKGGDWPDDGCEIDVTVTAEDDDDDTDSVSVTIESADAKRDRELVEDGEEIAERVGEWSTERIIVLGGTAYYVHENGGENGAHDRRCGDGVWRERPVAPTRELTRSEARCLMLDWGYAATEVATKTHDLKP